MKHLFALFVVYLFTGLLVGWVSLGFVIYWLWFPVRTLEIHTPLPVHLMSTTVKRGDALQYYLDYCKYTNDTPIVLRWLLDGQQIPLTSAGPGGLPQGCNKVLLTNAVVPDTVNPGVYHLHVEVIYQVNPIRRQLISYDTEDFTVTK